MEYNKINIQQRLGTFDAPDHLSISSFFIRKFCFK